MQEANTRKTVRIRLQCSSCPEIVERSNKTAVVTCFACRKKQKQLYSRTHPKKSSNTIGKGFDKIEKMLSINPRKVKTVKKVPYRKDNMSFEDWAAYQHFLRVEPLKREIMQDN